MLMHFFPWAQNPRPALRPGVASGQRGRSPACKHARSGRASWVLLSLRFLSQPLVSSHKKQTGDCCITPCKDSGAACAHSFSQHGWTASPAALGSPPLRRDEGAGSRQPRSPAQPEMKTDLSSAAGGVPHRDWGSLRLLEGVPPSQIQGGSATEYHG